MFRKKIILKVFVGALLIFQCACHPELDSAFEQAGSNLLKVTRNAFSLLRMVNRYGGSTCGGGIIPHEKCKTKIKS